MSDTPSVDPLRTPVETVPPELVGRSVGDVVVRIPKTLPPTLTVGAARAAFDDDHVHMLLVTDDGRLLGTLLRPDLPADADPAAPALDHARLAGRTIAADVPAEDARRLLMAAGRRRLAVTDADGRLLGLLCLKRRLTSFCSDTDVAARAADGPDLATGR